jgi:phosphoenolpyruvate carboxykinase (GTP)
MPRYEDITWEGLDFSKDKYLKIMNINRDGALAEAAEIKQFFDSFGSHLPPELEAQRKKLEERAGAAPQVWSMAA